MKSILLLTILSISYSFSAQYSSDKTDNHPTKELIVAFEKLSSKQFAELDAAINNIPGLKPLGQCSKMNVYYFSFDETIYFNDEQAFEALTIKTKDFLPLMKIGSTIEQVSNACNQ